MRAIKAAGAEALATLDRLREQFRQTGEYPFLIGDDGDLEKFNDLTIAPADGGQETIAESETFDVAGWFAAHAPMSGMSWPWRKAPAQTTVSTLHEVLGGKLKPFVHIGLVSVQQPWDIFAALGYGGWNDCPDPHVHVAVHRHWHQRHKALPIAVSGDVVECQVALPPADRKAALGLACEQYAYCYDIVEQGLGSTGKLGSSLLESSRWYFWWD